MNRPSGSELARTKPRDRVLSLCWGGVLGVVVAWIVLDRWVLARPYHLQPGIRTTIWKRVRDLPPRPEDGLAVQRSTFRTARRYIGPPPSDEQISEYLRAGSCDAFHDYLRQKWREQVDAAVAELDGVLDQISDAAEKSIEEAKRLIRGTDDEFVHLRDRSQEDNDKAARSFKSRAQAAGDVCVSDSWGGMMRHYRISRIKHPRVYELRQQDADLNEIRQDRLHEEIARLLEQDGRAVLDSSEMDRVWAETRAQGMR